MALEEDAVRWAINNLRQQSLVRAIQRSDSRVMKYQHLISETLNLDAGALAVMCVLMLRGAQTVGEIRARTGRLAEFASADEVEKVLTGLVGRQLVAELPRRPGQKEARYAHLLSGAATVVSVDASAEQSASTPSANAGHSADRVVALEQTVEDLRRDLAELRTRFEEFQRQFG